MSAPSAGDEAIRLSIVVLNHNSGALLEACLESVFADAIPGPYELIIPDNASTDDSVERVVAKWGDKLQVFPTGKNRGYAGGNNYGIRHSRGEYVLLLNPDTLIRPGCIRSLQEFMDARPRVACAGPKILNTDGTYQTSAKRKIPDPVDALTRALGLSRLFPSSRKLTRFDEHYRDPDETQQVEVTGSCCMLLRRRALEELGLFDEGYFMYCEDVDWFTRARDAGWQVWYVAGAVIVHHHAYSVRFRKGAAVRDFHNSMIRFYRKHHAARHPAPVNWLMIAGVHLRQRLVLLRHSVTGWH